MHGHTLASQTPKPLCDVDVSTRVLIQSDHNNVSTVTISHGAQCIHLSPGENVIIDYISPCDLLVSCDVGVADVAYLFDK